MGDLDANADAAESRPRAFLQSLEVTPLTRSFKMVVLLAMLAEEALPGSIPIERLVARVRVIVQRSAALRTEFADALAEDAALVAVLEEHPIPRVGRRQGYSGREILHLRE